MQYAAYVYLTSHSDYKKYIKNWNGMEIPWLLQYFGKSKCEYFIDGLVHHINFFYKPKVVPSYSCLLLD